MNKKGFTLVELLAVIVILSILAIVTTTIIFKVVSNSRENIYKQNIDYIEKAAEKWALDNYEFVGTNVPYCLNISKLESEGYVTKDSLKDPREKKTKQITGYVKITYDATYKQNEFKYMENCS
ncbi:MAG: prepilin-type N-terminal cleavage/methylation domain-containing protein [Bacilli bacterium]|nr:prepilin-type N-terminal cleavage/methylation domain-containing protein [Bacilli bacterium]